MGFIETVIAGLVVAAVTGGVSWVAGRKSKEKEYKTKHEAAIKAFSGELRKLIISTNPNANDAVTKARAIVSVRNSLRATLTSLAASLNSNIDRLEELVGPDDRRIDNPAQVRERLAVLKESWPAKDAEIEVAIRKIMAEMGLVEN